MMENCLSNNRIFILEYPLTKLTKDAWCHPNDVDKCACLYSQPSSSYGGNIVVDTSLCKIEHVSKLTCTTYNSILMSWL